MSRQQPVAEAMTRDVLSFSTDHSVSSAMDALVERGINGAPVVDAGGAVVGMLSTSDLIVQGASLHFPTVISVLGATIELPSQKSSFEDDLRRTLGGTVGEVMRTDPVTVSASDTVEAAATLLHDNDISRLPVVGDGGELVGIIARIDVLRAIMSREGSG